MWDSNSAWLTVLQLKHRTYDYHHNYNYHHNYDYHHNYSDNQNYNYHHNYNYHDHLYIKIDAQLKRSAAQVLGTVQLVGQTSHRHVDADSNDGDSDVADDDDDYSIDDNDDCDADGKNDDDYSKKNTCLLSAYWEPDRWVN